MTETDDLPRAFAVLVTRDPGDGSLIVVYSVDGLEDPNCETIWRMPPVPEIDFVPAEHADLYFWRDRSWVSIARNPRRVVDQEQVATVRLIEATT